MFRNDLLAGKRILITGGGTGLGKSIGKRYLELGAELFICGRRLEVLEAARAEAAASSRMMIGTIGRLTVFAPR